MNFLKLLIPAVFACLCNTGANVLWKLQFEKKPLSIHSISDFFLQVFTLNIIGGMFFYGLSMLLFFYMLSNFKLSAIIPVTCLTYVFNMITAVVIFGEKLTLNQVMGTGIIILGLIIISQTPVSA